MYYLRKTENLKKAQMSIEYLGGFTIFISLIIYVFFMVLSFIPQNLNAINENIIETSAWGATQNIIEYLSLKKDGSINESALSVISKCTVYNAHPSDPIALASVSNYTFVKNNIVNISSNNEFNLVVDQYVIALTTKKNILNYTGSIILSGKEIFFETFNTTTSQYDSVVVDNGTKITAIKNDIIYLGSQKYRVDNIDTKGQFVILKSNIVDCGKQAPDNIYTTIHKRYLKQNNNIVGLKFTYWGY